MLENRSFLISECCEVTFACTSHTCRNWWHLFWFGTFNTYFRSTRGNNRLQTLMLVHIHNNILDNINLADVVKITLLIEKTAANKHSGIFLRIIHNICKVKLTLWCFSYIYISYQMYKTRSLSLNRLSQGNDNRISTSWKSFNIDLYKVCMVSFRTEPFLIFWIFMNKTLVKRKRFVKIVL